MSPEILLGGLKAVGVVVFALLAWGGIWAIQRYVGL